MDLAVVLLTLVVVAAVVALVAAPLRAPAAREDDAAGERRELETAKEAKYREIRDAELDYRTGKLSREDFEALDGELRAEALALLRRLDAL